MRNTTSAPAEQGGMGRLPAQFVVTSVTKKQDGSTSKIPIDPATGKPINPHDPANWLTATDAQVQSQPHGGTYGFVVTENDPYVFLDFDKCLTPDGTDWTPEAKRIVSRFTGRGAACEVSISGIGLHVLCTADQARLANLRNRIDGWREIYWTGRFVQFGRDGLAGWRGDPGIDCTDLIVEEYPERDSVDLYGIPDEGPVAEYGGPQDDATLIQMFHQCRPSVAVLSGQKASLPDLWAGNAAVLGSYYPDPDPARPYDYSAAEAALAAHLAFWTGRDVGRTFRLMQMSNVRPADQREKWQRPSYIFPTIRGAAAKVKSVYTSRDVTTALTLPGAEIDVRALFIPWVSRNLSELRAPKPIYGDHFARGYTSMTAAPPKTGKGLLTTVESVDMVTGRGFLTGGPSEPLRVVTYNAEDAQEVLDLRVAGVLTHYGIDQSEIEGCLYVVSGIDQPSFKLLHGEQGTLNEKLLGNLEEFCRDEKVDVLKFDPLQDLSASPESNEVFRELNGGLRSLAQRANIAIGIVHHTRKLTQGVAASMDDARGGSALRGGARFNRLLVPMTEAEGAQAGVENHRHFFRIAEAESNLAPPSSQINQWFEKRNVSIPFGESVGVAVPWAWPDAFDGIRPEHVTQVQLAVASSETPPRSRSNANHWIGHIIGRVTGLDPKTKHGKERINTLLDKWVIDGFLQRSAMKDARQGREVEIIEVGPKKPPPPLGSATGGEE